MYAPLLSLPPTGTGMGMTAENLADKFDISREEMDKYALSSHQLAKKATDEGYFKEEIVPITIKASRKQPERIFDTDESIRDTTLEKLSSLPPVFKKDGKITAGNACPISDGAAAVIITKRTTADSLGIKPLGKLVGYAVVGVHPDIMGYGPVPATKKVLDITGISLKDIDIFEVNEAFAPVPLVFMKEIGIPRDILNVNGGAIALGHPIGATGARLVTTLLHIMKKRGAKRGLIGICQGSGMGTATIWESCS
jgi:acetyl-CoA C-acetyltransferase